MRTKIPKFQTKLFLRNGYDFLTERNFVFTHRFSEISKLIQIINHIKAHSSFFTDFKTDNTFDLVKKGDLQDQEQHQIGFSGPFNFSRPKGHGFKVRIQSNDKKCSDIVNFYVNLNFSPKMASQALFISRLQEMIY